jgi:hypothetical protein
MFPTIPIATDHLYKFITLFGLVFLVFSLIGIVYIFDKYNNLFYKNIMELETLKLKDELSKVEALTKTRLEHMNKLYITDKNTMQWVLAFCGALGLWLFIIGLFLWWRKVQPQQDELLRLQIEKLRLELAGLDRQLK